ncbi:ABC transporter ATP-binding protein [Helcococcus kunzii]|uniref:ABC transporter ATP-binding protein n=1 Tax=Helcococcus kunzii TaxID=40091 RepID=UPI001C9755F5|nr:ABC transporter ATP-binding protein [Helcococcus kunzii]QZO76758.1 ABC transporter ATP-binding protein [Helcococcus kunzii]
MKDIILQSENLVFRYKNNKKNILNNVSVEVERGKFIGIIGPNGSGKSTLFKCLMGEVTPKSGMVYFEGKNIFSINSKERAKKIAIVQQKNQAVEDFTVREVIELGRTPYRRTFCRFGEDDKKAVDNALYLVALEDLQDRYCHQLSGGQLQRVWLGLALAQEPDLILLDEPTTYLDVKYQIQLMEMIRELVDNHGITCVAVLHDLNQVLNYVDYSYLLNDGEIFSFGDTKQILNSDTIKSVFDVDSKILQSIDDRKVLDIFLDKEDKNVHKDIKVGQIRQI